MNFSGWLILTMKRMVRGNEGRSRLIQHVIIKCTIFIIQRRFTSQNHGKHDLHHDRVHSDPKTTEIIIPRIAKTLTKRMNQTDPRECVYQSENR